MCAARFADTRVVKKLAPHAAGAKRLGEQFGDALVCVRYRVDEAARRRYTTVELVVAEGKLPPAPNLFIRVAYGEKDLRRKVKAAGGVWHPDRKLWSMPRAAAKQLNLLSRAVGTEQAPA